MGFYERTEEILAAADYRDAGVVGQLDRADARVSGGAVHLYFVLGLKVRVVFGHGSVAPFLIVAADFCGARMRKWKDWQRNRNYK